MLGRGRADISLRAHQRGRERGQTLILMMLAMPLFFALLSLVVDGGNILVHKRNIQVAADAASLAMSQSIDLATKSCNAACQDQGLYYANKNGAKIEPSTWHMCDAAHTTN